MAQPVIPETQAYEMAREIWFSSGNSQPTMKDDAFIMLVTICAKALAGKEQASNTRDVMASMRRAMEQP